MSAKNPYTRDDYPQPLDIDWLIENRLPIYVRNMTRPRGQLAVNFPHISGKVKVIKIPRTHLPIKLTGQLSGDTIQMSDDFRQCCDKGVIDIVRPDIAWEELQNPDNAYEVDRLRLSEFSAKQAFVSKRVADMDKSVENRIDANAPSLEPLGVETNVINPRVLGMVEKLTNGDLPIKAALSELKTMEAELKDTDCSYIIANGPDGQVRSYIQKVLARLRGKQIAGHSVDDSAPSADDDFANPSPEMLAEEERRAAIAAAQQGESRQARQAALEREGIDGVPNR